MSETKEGPKLGRVSLSVDLVFTTEVEPAIKARKLRELAMWYRAFAERAGNPAIWEARLRTAEDLDTEARRIDQQRGDQ
jgi:hypothetical protein